MNCPCCSRPEPLDIIPDGIWYEPLMNNPVGIAYRCACGTNRTLPWTSATTAQRIEAGLVQLSRDAENEIMMAPTR